MVKQVSDSFSAEKINVNSVIRQLFDAESRSSYLIGFGFPESSDGLSDLEAVRELASKLGFDPLLILDCFCLGKISPDHSRLIKIRFSSRFAAMKFLTSLKSAISNDLRFSKVWFRKDLTPLERVADLKLREKLFEIRKFNHNSDCIIYHGEIIKRSDKPNYHIL